MKWTTIVLRLSIAAQKWHHFQVLLPSALVLSTQEFKFRSSCLISKILAESGALKVTQRTRALLSISLRGFLLVSVPFFWAAEGKGLREYMERANCTSQTCHRAHHGNIWTLLSAFSATLPADVRTLLSSAVILLPSFNRFRFNLKQFFAVCTVILCVMILISAILLHAYHCIIFHNFFWKKYYTKHVSVMSVD